MTELDRYLEMTGQTEREVFARSEEHGVYYIYDLVIKALRERKKVVYVVDKIDKGCIPSEFGHYELVPL